MTARRRDLLSLATLSLAALILGHHLVFLTAYGPSYWTMLERTGHGPMWAITVATVAILTAGLLVLGIRRLISLARIARGAQQGEIAVREGRLSDLALRVAWLWVAILPIALALFVLNENLERAFNGLPLPGLAVLTNGHASPALIFAIVAAALALVAGLYRWRRDVLAARIEATRPGWDRSLERRLRPPLDLQRRRPRSVLGSRLAGRAPPSAPRPSAA